MPETPSARRPIATRDTKWAAAIAASLAKAGVRPNVISIFSAVFAGGAGLALYFTSRSEHPWQACSLFVLAALGIQARLLCNLFDGMVAIEGGFKTKSGDIFNELPDRFADVFVLVGAGYAARYLPGGLVLGWLAAVLAVGTAYVRALGASAGAGQCFLGPMAKQHRMAVVTAGSLLAAVVIFWGYAADVMRVAVAVVALGALLTVIRRTLAIIRTLEARP